MLLKFAVPLIAAAVVVSIAPAAARPSHTVQLVPHWSLFEVSIPNPCDYANPFTDVALMATFTSPSGRKVKAIGFYDGEY